MPAGIFQQHRETADTFDQRGDVRLAKALLQQDEVTFPLAELAPMRDIVRLEQDADITVEPGWQTLASVPRTACRTVVGQIPSQVVTNSLARVDVAVDGLLAHAQPSAFVSHSVADLLRCPAVLQPLYDAGEQVGVADEFALPGAAIDRPQLRGGTVIAIALRHAWIGEVIALELAKYGRAAALQHARHFVHRHPACRQRSILRRSS